MLHVNPLMGEPVTLALVVNPTSTNVSVALGIFDDNGNPRPLQTYERLVLDSIICDISTGTADVLNVAAGASSTAIASSTLLLSFNAAVGEWHTDKEGMGVPIGITPSVLASSSTATLKISGVARILEATTQGVRPNWQAKLTPGGNF